MKLRLYSESIGMPVVVEYYDRPLDFVHDFIIDPENGKIVAFLLSRNKIVSPLDVIDWGQGLSMSDESYITSIDEVLRAKIVREQRISIIGQRVITENNEYIGRAHDLSFNAATFTLHQLFVSRGFFIIRWFQTIIPAANIVKITAKHIMVRSAVEKKRAKSPEVRFETA